MKNTHPDANHFETAEIIALPEQVQTAFNPDDRLMTEYTYGLEETEEAIAVAGLVIRGEMEGVKDSTVTVLTGIVKGVEPGRYQEAAMAVRRDERKDGHYAERFERSTAYGIKTSLKPQIGVESPFEIGAYIQKIFINRPDGSQVKPNDSSLTDVEDLRLDMFRDLYGSDGRHGQPADYTDMNPASRLSGIIERTDPAQAAEVREEVRAILPAVLEFSEYKMYQWHYNTGVVGTALVLVESLVENDPKAVRNLDLGEMAQRLVIQSASLSYDLTNAGSSYDRQKLSDKLASTTVLLNRINAIQAWQYATTQREHVPNPEV